MENYYWLICDLFFIEESSRLEKKDEIQLEALHSKIDANNVSTKGSDGFKQNWKKKMFQRWLNFKFHVTLRFLTSSAILRIQTIFSLE